MHQLKSELSKIRVLPPWKKLSYLWDYYKLHLFFLLFFLVFFFYFLFPLFSEPKKETALSVAVIDSSPAAKADTSTLNDAFLDFSGKDKDTARINIDTSGTTSDSSSSDTVKVAILLSSVGENDIVICGRELYEQYNANGAFLNLSAFTDSLPTSAADALLDNAVNLSDCEKWNRLGYTDYTPVYACIPVSCKNPERAIAFINFLYSD